ncbi:MAG TPA: crotonase/enoyl-CoA hydratase family protein [Blastocatellia bacterium]
MSIRMLETLHSLFDRAETEQAVVVLSALGKSFSGGFDLKLLSGGTAGDIYTMLKLGGELAVRILSFPMPVVAACHGSAYPMGAFLILSSDVRIAADGDYKIGMNEVAIGLTVPGFAIEVARQRLIPAYFNRAIVTGQMFGPAEAVTAGFFDWMVPASELESAATSAAEDLAKINLPAHTASKLRARDRAIKAVRAAIDNEYSLAYAEEIVVRRTAAL